jgi:hypothetical protein
MASGAASSSPRYLAPDSLVSLISVLVPNQRQNFSMRIADGNGPRKEEVVIAITAAQGKRVFPDFARLETFADLLHNALHVVGMRNLFPAPAGHILKSGTGVFKPAIVVPEDVALLVCHPSQLRNVVRQRAEATLAFAQGFFCVQSCEMVAAGAPARGSYDHQTQNSSEDQRNLSRP